MATSTTVETCQSRLHRLLIVANCGVKSALRSSKPASAAMAPRVARMGMLTSPPWLPGIGGTERVNDHPAECRRAFRRIPAALSGAHSVPQDDDAIASLDELV